MEIEELIKKIHRQARLLGSCDLFTGGEKTLEDVVRLFTSVQGQEFCLNNRFPHLATFRLFKGMGVERYGIYIDAGIVTLKNPKRAFLVGHTHAIVNCDSLERHVINVFQGATATVNACGWAVVRVNTVQGAHVIRNASGNAIIL